MAGLTTLVGALIFRGVLNIPVFADATAGDFGGVGTSLHALTAATAALTATGLLHLLLVSAPRALRFFNWIVWLATAVATVSPFSLSNPPLVQFATAMVNLVTGVAIVTLLMGVGVSAREWSYPRRWETDGDDDAESALDNGWLQPPPAPPEREHHSEGHDGVAGAQHRSREG
ncbi:DUF6069 family protein [Salinactinospora qingdaonensis]|uniref:DUF6069 family protein n=1 Tax=Salinactinospora qingdaonensis TaxID=702744 RepID=A0ABP7FZB3_9ACTN